ncbi:hypothetical protein AWZ03_003226 [Drosophila navojoa]|uniref:Insulin-like domain-containing protein n=1 Tax=Drosophila navojoa TaxID=7232 RepID=A0A484BRE2_DRONA|nr:hypothetical protein AWZ03_003226 [Drosophila navojoa]
MRAIEVIGARASKSVSVGMRTDQFASESLLNASFKADRSRLLLVLRQQLDTGEKPQAPAERINGAGVERVLRRSRRRITHKCCWNGCTYDDIREYCA